MNKPTCTRLLGSLRLPTEETAGYNERIKSATDLELEQIHSELRTKNRSGSPQHKLGAVTGSK